MTDKIFSDIDLFVITTIEPSFEPTREPTFVITMNNTSSGFSYSGLTNYEKRIVIFTSLGGLMLVFMLIALFFHIKSRIMHNEQNKKVDNELLDIMNNKVTELVINENESNI
jgi:hypothetical protein